MIDRTPGIAVAMSLAVLLEAGPVMNTQAGVQEVVRRRLGTGPAG
jgi:hypothetical protein